MPLLHHRIHMVSHFQVALFASGVKDAYPEQATGVGLVTYGGSGIVVSTAWDDNGKVPPEVDVAVLLEEPASGLLAIAEGPLEIGDDGALVGNAIDGDLEKLTIPAGRYRVQVSADRREPFFARKVAFAVFKS